MDMHISSKDYERARFDYNQNWELRNKILYDLCQRHPRHQDFQTINAKLWLIGRTYATGIERMIPSKGDQGSSLMQLSVHIYKNRNKLDSILNRLSSIKEPLNPKKLKIIVNEHGRFSRLLGKILRKNRSARSFASKYLHFHCRAVPLYDSFANEKLRKLSRWDDRWEIFEMPELADEEYFYFVMRFWHLYQQFRKIKKSVTVRHVDCFLLW